MLSLIFFKISGFFSSLFELGEIADDVTLGGSESSNESIIVSEVIYININKT